MLKTKYIHIGQEVREIAPALEEHLNRLERSLNAQVVSIIMYHEDHYLVVYRVLTPESDD